MNLYLDALMCLLKLHFKNGSVRLLESLVTKSPSEILEPFVGKGLEDFGLVTNSRSTIRYLIETLRSKAMPEALEPFASETPEDLSLRSGGEYQNFNILKDTFCVARQYYWRKTINYMTICAAKSHNNYLKKLPYSLLRCYNESISSINEGWTKHPASNSCFCKRTPQKRIHMTTLSSFSQGELEIYVDHETGESFASVSSYARMSGRALSTISERINGLRSTPCKKAEVLTSKGLQGIRLIDEDLIAEWLPKDNPAVATQLMKLGVRLFMHKLVGYIHQEPKQQPALPTDFVESLEMLLAAEKEKKVLAAANKELQAATAELQAVNAELAPKAEAADILLEAGSNLTFQEAAQVMGIPNIGRNNLFKALVELKLIINTQHPYQRYVEQGIFVVRETQTNWGVIPQILITQKGLQYIIPLLKEHGMKSSKIDDRVADSFRLTPKAS